MGNFKDLKRYFDKYFDEEQRFLSAAGQIRFEMTCFELDKYIKNTSKILDIGGGVGAFSKYYALKGNLVYYGDISTTLTNKARLYLHDIENIVSIKELNIVDLNEFSDNSFDFVICLGPFHHLPKVEDRIKGINEISRVLKPSGLAFVSFIPIYAGFDLLMRKVIKYHKTLDNNIIDNFNKNHVLSNLYKNDFQEGYFPNKKEIINLVSSKFNLLDIFSIKGLATSRGDELYKLKESNFNLYTSVMNMIYESRKSPSLIETHGHCLTILKNRK